MSQHGTPVTPRNYAVWYEYVSGDNAALTDEIEPLIEAGDSIDEQTMGQLHARFLAPPGQGRIDQSREEVLRVISDIGEIVGTAGGEAARYEDSLASYRARLGRQPDLEQIRAVIDGLAEETRAVCASAAELRRRLDESREETESLRNQLAQARSEASTDVLTGLANRRALETAFEVMASYETDDGHCLLLADIDRFKSVNDIHGHLVGDKVIKHVGEVLQSSVKGRDTVARYGGEEFAVLLPDTPFSGAMAVAENIRRQVERARLVKSQSREPIGTVTVSVGVARYCPGEPFEALAARADAALYRAKQAGRNRVEHQAQTLAGTGTQG
jgi:diguanylate cyclase